LGVFCPNHGSDKRRFGRFLPKTPNWPRFHPEMGNTLALGTARWGGVFDETAKTAFLLHTTGGQGFTAAN
jgi:hypothetical protein